MATLSETVQIVFQGVDQTSGAITGVTSGLDKLTNSVGKVTGPLNTLGNTILAIDAAMVALGGAIITQGVQSAIKAEAAFLDLQKVLSDQEAQTLPAIQAEIRALSLEFGELGPTVTQITADFRQAGFGIDEALALTRQALTATRISELDTAEASQLLIAAIRGFGLEASDAGRILDITNEVSNNFSTSLGEILIGLADVSPVARLAGLSVEEMTGFLTPAIEVFGSGSEVARAYRTALQRLGDDSGPVTKALADLGVSQFNANGELRQAGDILKDLLVQWPNLSEAQQTYFAANLFGIDQSAKLTQSLSNQNSVMAVTETATNSAGSSLTELNVRMAATEIAVDRARVAFATLSTAIGNQFLAPTNDAANAVTDLGVELVRIVEKGGLEPLFEALRPLLTEFTANVREIIPLLDEAFVGLDFNPIVRGLESIGSAFSDLFNGVDLTTPEGLQKALQGVVDTIGVFLEINAGFIAGLKPLFDLISELAEGFRNLDTDTANTIGQIIGLGKSINTLLPAVSTLSSGIGVLAGGFGLLLGTKGIIAAASGMSTLATGTGAAGGAMALLSNPVTAVVAGVGALGVGTAIAVNHVADLREETEFYRQAADKVEAEIRAIDAASRDYTKILDSEVQAVKDAARAQDEQTTAILTSGNAWTTLNGKVVAVINPLTEVRENLIKQNSALDDMGNDVRLVSREYDEFGNLVSFTTEKINENEVAFRNNSVSAAKAAETAETFKLKMLDIQGELAKINLQGLFDLEIAKIESETKQVEAAFDSIGVTVQSTGELLSDLFGAFADASFVAQDFLKEQIEKEQERRDAALELQAELTEAQIRNLDARSESLRRGESLIKVEANNLVAPLEIIWQEILREIQIKASAEGVEFLLDLPAAP